jgi:hypothetical protein
MIPDIRSLPGDSSAVAVLCSLAEYYGCDLHGGGAFERLVEKAMRRDVYTDEVTAAAVDLGLPVAHAGALDLTQLKSAVSAGKPVMCVTKGMEYVAVTGADGAALTVQHPLHGRLSVPQVDWLQLWGGGGLILDGPRREKAQHGGRGGGMAADRFRDQHPMPVGSQVTAREAINHYDANTGKWTFEAAAGDKFEVLGHTATGVKVRNKAGQEAEIPRHKLRGKTTGRGHKVPGPEGMEKLRAEEQERRAREEAPQEEEHEEHGGHLTTEHPKKPGWHSGGSCRQGQRADLTHCQPKG